MSSASVQRETTGVEKSLVGRQERLAAWLQFPRRVVFLLIAFAVALLLIYGLRAPLLGAGPRPRSVGPEVDWSVSWTMRGKPVVELIGERLPNTLLLLGAAMFVALPMALAAALIAVLVHKLEEKTGPLGSVLKGLGRLWVFSSAAVPVFVLAILLIFVFAFRLKLLPPVGMARPGGRQVGLGDRISHLVLPTLTLALLPAALTAQAMAREIALPRRQGGVRVWLAGLFERLGTLSGQIGGLLGATVLVEMIYAWPGIGRLLIESAMRRDLPLLLGMLNTCAILIMVERLAAELFCWLARLIRVPILSPQPEPTRWRRTARKTYVVLALVLLLVPLGVVVAGLTVDQDAVMRVDTKAVNQPPSDDHPWGTDRLGRDVRARVLRGGLITVGTVALVAATVLIPGGLGGALAGYLAARRVWWAESLADLLMLPADVLLFIPSLLGVMAMRMLLGQRAGSPGAVGVWVGMACAIMLMPRAARVYQGLWTSAPERRRGLIIGLAGTGALFTSTLFAGFALIAAVDFMGFGTPPPLPTLGIVVGESFQMLRVGSRVVLAPSIIIGVCALAFYIATDALVGFFHSKEPLARMNE